MSVKPAPPKPTDSGPITSGKGLDALDRFIIQSWGPRCHFGLWTPHLGILSAPKAGVEQFLNEHLARLWERDEFSAVLTLEPPYDPFVILGLTNDHKHLGEDSKYKPSHWKWKVIPNGEGIPVLAAALATGLLATEDAYLRGLRDGLLSEAWAAFTQG